MKKLLLIWLNIYPILLLAQVPNTESFSLQDVINNIGLGTSLSNCLTNAQSEAYDSQFNRDEYAPANSLLRFRNYNHINSNPWDITSTSGRTGIHTGHGLERQIIFRSDGSQFITCTEDELHIYDMSVSWDINTAESNLDATTITLPNDVDCIGLYITVDGLHMYISDNTPNQNTIHQYSFSTAWDFTTISYIGSVTTGSQPSDIRDIYISDTGDKLMVSSGTMVYEYTLNTPFDITSKTANYATGSLPNIYGMTFRPDGTSFYFGNNNTTPIQIIRYQLSIGFSLSSWDFTLTQYIAVDNEVVRGLFFKPDGRRYYVHGLNEIYQYDIP